MYVIWDDERLAAGLICLPREGADDVVGLVARQRVDGDTELPEQLLHALDLGTQLVGHRPARRLVRRVPLVTERGDRQVEGRGQVLRARLLDRAQGDRGRAER